MESHTSNNEVALTKPNTTMKRPAVPVTSSRKRPVPSSKPAPRKRLGVDGSKIIGSTTSLAERKRRQPTCSLKSLQNLEDEEMLESDFVGYFGSTSESHWTWGKTENEPIPATKKRGRAPRFRKGGNSFATLFGYDADVFEKIPNSADRSIFLRFPLEIREKFYSILLLYPKPIVVKFDLSTVERDNLRCHPILRVCKQISEEASNFLYRANIFRAILREPRITYHLHESFILYSNFLALFQNVIIESQKENYDNEWYERASVAVEKLVEAKTKLHSLSFVVAPQRVGMTTTALGIERNPITFADFFWFHGRLMKAFRKLPCKYLHTIIKKTRTIPNPNAPNTNSETDSNHPPDADVVKATDIIIAQRFLISLDLRYLARAAIEEGYLRNAETVEIQRRNAWEIRKELNALKRRVEAVFENDERAVAEGKCRIMGEDEKIADIISLSARK
jgi:hypothetical protein